MRAKPFQPIVLAGFLLLPLILWALYNVDRQAGLIWFFLHQIYYAPLSWLGQPFFHNDSEVGFWVLPLGRLLTAVVYALLGCLMLKAIRFLRHKS
jgi:hypothetical protein